MNAGYLHLAINHFPIITTIIGCLILLSGYFLKNEGIKLAGLGALCFGALMAIPAILTGDPAADLVHNIPGVSHDAIESHEGIAYAGFWALMFLGILSAMGIYGTLKREKFAGKIILAALFLSILVSGWMVYVGRTGGKIRHSEFSGNAQIMVPSEEQHDSHD